MNSKYIFVTAGLVLFLALAFPTLAADFIPVEEGWVNGNSDVAWSQRVPDMLGARLRGQENAWATYLMFDLPSDESALSGKELILQFEPSEEGPMGNAGTYQIHGIAGAYWTYTSLRATNAPGWDADARDVGPDVEEISTVTITDPEASEIAFPVSDFEFCRSHAGQTVTFIITKNGSRRTSQFRSNRGDSEKGPRIR